MGTKGKAASASSSLKSKSPAEFFAEHQNIAGFDNAGKSLYTTIREFVENSLDAAEAINRLPDVHVTLERLDSRAFHALRGISAHQRKDQSLYHAEKPSKQSASTKAKAQSTKAKQQLSASMQEDEEYDAFSLPAPPAGEDVKDDEGEQKEDRGRQFFRVSCRDNGAGMPHASIPSMLGVVLSSTKYGVKQTRGKFGLGAKMALVWAKKSTGLPIEVYSAVDEDEDVSHCRLDIDIHRNQPRVLVHERQPNTQRWRGTEISVVIEGNWTAYQSKAVKYFKQLAVITPYANLTFDFRDLASARKSFTNVHLRRTEFMPPPAVEVKHHPSSVDNLLVERLMHETKETKLGRFLVKEFSSISTQLAHRLLGELGEGFEPNAPLSSMNKQQIHQLTSLLKEAKFDRPSADCLSPAGEYNLRLGIIKELHPEMVATFRDEPGVSEGHPFVVEAAVSLGGKCKSGLNIYRYANRIPLLFEGSNDVVSVVCNKSVKWAAYKIKLNTDRIGVFVSIVSSKIPFKGTSKEYIGDDRDVLHDSIRHAIIQCCLQLKKSILTKAKHRDIEERKRTLKKFIPDVSRAVWSILSSIQQRGSAIHSWQQRSDQQPALSRKRKLEEPDLGVSPECAALHERLMKRVRAGEVDEARLSAALHVCVEKKNSEAAMEFVVEQGRKSGQLDHCTPGTASTIQHNNSVTVYHPMLALTLLQ